MIFNPVARVGLIAAALLLAACDKPPENEFQGWIEADLIFVSPDEQGRVETMMVREGDRVEKGTPLFTLDADLQRADLAVAEASVVNTKQALDRATQLLKSASGTQRDYDVAQAAYRQADAQLAAAKTRLDRRKLASPIEGIIQQIYFRPGETVPPSRPIIAVLPPGNIKVRFFIPETFLARIAIGDEVRVTCDGCPDNITAPITFISRNVEFTPPVIYSLEERSKLVYLVEARPADTGMLRVGQPVTVEVKLRETSKGTPVGASK
jgi:HlyD family secretion protein